MVINIFCLLYLSYTYPYISYTLIKQLYVDSLHCSAKIQILVCKTIYVIYTKKSESNNGWFQYLTILFSGYWFFMTDNNSICSVFYSSKEIISLTKHFFSGFFYTLKTLKGFTECELGCFIIYIYFYFLVLANFFTIHVKFGATLVHDFLCLLQYFSS